MKPLFNLKMKTNIYSKTKVYKKKSIRDELAFTDPNIPKFKIILSQVQAQYKANCKLKKIKPISINKMKTLYGLPNNLNDYFVLNPKFKNAYNPKTIHLINAYKLIFIFEMSIETANMFLESLHHPKLESEVCSDQAKAIYYALRCGYSLEQTNEFLIEHKLPGLIES